MRNPFPGLLSRLSVGRKLVVIYLLDLTAVIFVSGILINEKYIAINFARDELTGNAYVAGTRQALLDAARASGRIDTERARLSAGLSSLQEIEERLGDGLGSKDLNRMLRDDLDRLTHLNDNTLLAGALDKGRELVVRVGNQSKLILDPDLDSYYTMSLVVLRYAELLELAQSLSDVLVVPPGASESDARTRYLIIEGRLDAVENGIRSDFSEAVAAGGPALNAELAPHQARLAAAIKAFRTSTRFAMDDGRTPESMTRVDTARGTLIDTLDAAWTAAGIALNGLLRTRIESLFSRMWVHLGTAAFLLCVILSIVYCVGRQIVIPLRRLSAVTDTVSRTGDHALRAEWRSEDEIGRLVVGFNHMLAQLDRERELQKELAASARAAEAQQALVEAAPMPMMVTAIPLHDVLHANEPAKQWLAGRKSNPWAAGLTPGVRARFFQQLADLGAVDEFEVQWLAGAEPAWAVLSARRITYHGQDAVLTVFAPINHLKLMEQRLELWAKVFEASSEGIMIVNADRKILSVNSAFVRTTGYEVAEVVAQPPDLLIPADRDEPFFNAFWEIIQKRGSWQGEARVRRRNGDRFPAWIMINVVRDAGGDAAYYICTSIDITDRKKNEERIEFLAHHDVLTELPNRSLCIERLRIAMQQSERAERRVAVLFIDLDRFKDINDSLGHHVGDELLRSVARRLLDAVRGSDTVSRLGGDEFVVVLNGVQDSEEVADLVTRRLIPLVREPHAVGGAEIHVSCSVGIAMFPDDSRDLAELMRHADAAMYQAKAAGRNGAQFFTSEMTERTKVRLRIEAALRTAVARDELILHYQPRIDAITGAVTGAEGLLRWTSPELGLVKPAAFIPIAEESGLIVPLGEWVIEEACSQIAAWRRAGLPPIELSINLSTIQLRDDGLLNAIRTSMHDHCVPPGILELEITESALMQDVHANQDKLHRLRQLGVSIAIDDFGTGYSSLNYLSRLPLDRLKIDRSFVRNLVEDSVDLAITRSIIGLGRTLDLKVVAEGVETAEDAAVLRRAGCCEFQGFYFGKPMSADEFERMLGSGRGGHAMLRAA